MEPPLGDHNNHEHVINITVSGASPSPSPLAIQLNTVNSSITRTGGDGVGGCRLRLSLFGVWLLIMQLIVLGEVAASIAVLVLSRNENPNPLLLAWVIAFAAWCVATLTIIFWQWKSTRVRVLPGQSGMELYMFENNMRFRFGEYLCWTSNGRSKLVDRNTIALGVFFVFLVAFGIKGLQGRPKFSSSDAPNLSRLFLVLLTISMFGCTGLLLILCAIWCCCLSCTYLISYCSGDLHWISGASAETINALPMYKYKLQKNGGVVGAGTERERAISGDDAVCAICLVIYADNDELKELPCSHFYHKCCVDKWLKISSSCPICKSKVDENNVRVPAAANNMEQLSVNLF